MNLYHKNISQATLFIITITIIISLMSCRKDLVEEAELLGQWECVEIDKDGATPPLNGLAFEFRKDSTYTLKSKEGIEAQKGTWYTLEDRLYTTPEGGKLMFVVLGRSGDDTLRFHQNRGGMPETWTMVRR